MNLSRYNEFIEYLKSQGIKVEELKLSQVIESYKLYLMLN